MAGEHVETYEGDQAPDQTETDHFQGCCTGSAFVKCAYMGYQLCMFVLAASSADTQQNTANLST